MFTTSSGSANTSPGRGRNTDLPLATEGTEFSKASKANLRLQIRWEITHPGKLLVLISGTMNPASRVLQALRDFPGGSMVKNPPSSAGHTGSIPGWGTKIPHATGQLSLHAHELLSKFRILCCNTSRTGILLTLTHDGTTHTY